MSKKEAQSYKTLTHEGVDYIEREAFDDLMSAAKAMSDDMLYYMRRAHGTHSDGPISKDKKLYARFDRTLTFWVAFEDSIKGLGTDHRFGSIEDALNKDADGKIYGVDRKQTGPKLIEGA